MHVESGTQADLGNIEFLDGVDRQCRVCGVDYETETVAQKANWIGCEHPNCNYWLHASCLLGKSRKITNAFVRKIPYKCPVHRD